jgi:dipeptidyl aminopeptidase/acylaminoacyl peptidase
MKSPLAPSDLFSIVTAGDPQLACDGSVYFRHARLDREADATVTSIWRVDAAGNCGAFTAGRKDRLARVAPDGTAMAFVGERGERPQLFLIPITGGEARPIGVPYEKIGALAWSPDSRRIAFVATAEHDAPAARSYLDVPSGARHIRALPFKSDVDGLLDGTRNHIFVIDVETQHCERLTFGDFDAPEWSFGSDMHVIDVASKNVVALTHGEGPMGSPAWSHDGTTIAFTGHLHGDDAGGRFNTELLVIDARGGSIDSLSAALDRTVGDAIISDMRSGFATVPPAWSADDREIYVQVSDAGSCGVRAFARDGSATRIIAGGERDVFGFSYHAGSFALAFSTPDVPAELALLSAEGNERTLTALNAAFLAEKLVVAPQRLTPSAGDGTRLDGWLMLPPADGALGVLPLVLQVHGGPHVAYGHSFFFEFQVLAGTGCAVAYGNPRGGQSYGHAYADAITGDWGGVDAADVLSILDGALAAGPIDRAHVGLAGGSYGGFMTTWLLGHSDRFAAGVSMRAVNDFVSEVGAADIGWFLERELDAPPNLGDGGRALFDASPLRAAPQIDVPLLVEHSERDYRCPIDQGEQLFTLLRRLGKKQVEFVRFTGDGHELSRGGKPRNRILRLRAIAHWFIRHLQPDGAAPVADEAGALFRPLACETDVLF